MTTSHTPVLTQDELKTLVGQAALQYVTPGTIVGVGTGSTVNKFIDALAAIKGSVRAAVSSSNASTERLRAHGPLLVCCALGYSRSASAVAAWLITTRRAASVDEAVTILQRARPRVVLGPAHRRALASLNPIAEISGGA